MLQILLGSFLMSTDYSKGWLGLEETHTKDCKECGDEFTATGAGSSSRKYCVTCRPPTKVAQIDKPVKRHCQLEGCRKQIKGNHAAQKYCSPEHRMTAGSRRAEAKKVQENKNKSLFKNPDQLAIVKQERQGYVHKKIKADPDIERALIEGKVTASAVAVMFGVSTAAVTRSMQAILAEKAVDGQRAEWQQSKRVQAMLPKETWFKLKAMDEGDEGFDELVEQLIRAYTVFSKRYFNLEGRRPLIKDFHTTWIRSIIIAFATGGKRLILSPPRHGKSETLIRFVIWFICMDPNIRIGWFCASRDVAQLMLGAVKDILESNEQLIADVLPPGELFDPGLKSNNPWSQKELKVAQQSHVGAKSSSLLALGRTSKFLSRDMDGIIIDDMEDYDSTREESQRNYSRNKLAEIGTRKVEETAEVYIGSRQHPDDIPNLILELDDTILQWKSIVNSAHDIGCGLDPDDYEAHWDCMLFPEVRSYRYLMEKKLEMETLGLAHLYPLRYLNQPIPEEGQVFDVAVIKEHFNRERGLGLEKLPLGIVAAGLDPSARGIQAGFLWHYRGGKLSMVDLDAQQSGGMAGAHALMRNWHHMYGVTLWFYEDNSQQIEFFNDPRTRKLSIELGLTIKPFRTGRNKMDPELGISSMAPMYHDGSIDLPYGDSEARKKTNLLVRQLELWTTDGVANKKHKTDIKMASWFPFPYFVKMLKEERKTTLHIGAESSYPAYGGVTHAPWAATQYPGG
jgi:hypothetical protein